MIKNNPDITKAGKPLFKQIFMPIIILPYIKKGKKFSETDFQPQEITEKRAQSEIDLDHKISRGNWVNNKNQNDIFIENVLCLDMFLTN